MAKTIFQQQYREQQKQTALSAAQLATQRQALAAQKQANNQLALQSKMMLDEAAKKEYQKRIKGLAFEFNQMADQIKGHPTEVLRYIGARLLKFKIENSGLTTSSFEEIADKSFFGELNKTVDGLVSAASVEAKRDGDAYLTELAKRIGAITQLQSRRDVLQKSWFLDLVPLSLFFTFGKKVKALWLVLTSNYGVTDAMNYGVILNKADEIQNTLVSEFAAYRSQHFPEVSGLDFDGAVIEPPLKASFPLPGKGGASAQAPSADAQTGSTVSGSGISAFIQGLKDRRAYAIPVTIFFGGSLLYLLAPLGAGWVAGAFVLQFVAGSWATIYKLLNRNAVIWWPVPVAGFILFTVGAVLTPKDEKAAAKSPASPTERVITAASGLNMREQPNQTATPIVLLPSGAHVKLLEETNNSETIGGVAGKWDKVEYNGQQGYVFDGFLSK